MLRIRHRSRRPGGSSIRSLRAPRPTSLSKVSLLWAGLGMVALTACGGGTDEVAPPDDLSPAAAEGWTVAATKGCMSCHGRDGVGGTGPEWIGLAGSQRQLIDGTVVVADRDYLVRSLVDPQAERVSGYNILMPAVELTQAEIDAIIVYIEAIS